MSAPRLRRASARVAAVVAVVLLLAAGAVWWWVANRQPAASPGGPGSVARHLPDDPRLTYAGPFRNVRPGVKSVGDAVCAECHNDKAATYREHPMGRSITPMRVIAGRQPYDKAHNNPFEAFNSRFFVDREGDQVRHRRTAFDKDGRAVYDFSCEASYAIGSGTRGHSYLTEHDGFYFQTAISWYTQKQRWDVSPGFHDEVLAGRPVAGACFFCHVNHADPAEGTINHYPGSRFDGLSIGCERCHGPGELHEQGRRRKDPVGAFDDTIVHPGRLAPGLRDAVCEQCHLEGEARIVRRGRGLYDFRPGLPLSAFSAIFVRQGSHDRAVNHVEQMYDSGCYRGGREDQRIGCVSCHDPHERVRPEARIAHYRRACLNCHEQHGCSLSSSERVKQSPQDSCVDCHMARYATSDIPHTASTDHRISRRPRKASADDEPDSGHAVLLEPFYRGGADDPELMTRDLGLALARLADDNKEPGPRVAPLAVPLLESAVANDPEDWLAWEAKARLLEAVGRRSEALAAYQTVTVGAPKREVALADGAALARALGQGGLALDLWQRAIEVNPWMARYRGGLAALLAEKEKWDEFRPVCRDWLRLDPASVEARVLWVTLLLRTGRKEEARKEFENVKALHPQDIDRLQAWIDRESK